jgi:rhamnopyranosyl-N-acetylglucosaminyl-diphospho-decaprenol beta-1,3/1,4-galactofuranosyltransferase
VRVVAVVVTYKRPEVARCIRSLRAQTRPPDDILVVDNGGEASSALTDDPGLRIVETGENLGPAGGYAVGFAAAVDLGADKIWAMDDDSEPEPECLERLLSFGDTAILMPRQSKPSGWQGFPPSWHGPLIDAGVIRTIGVPRADLFFWGEDTEFFRRAQLAGFELCPVPDARIMHHDPAARRRGEPRNWRLYYEVRNTLELRLRIERRTVKHLSRAARTVFGKAAAIVLFEPKKLSSLRLWWWAIRDFSRHRFGRVVEPD